MFVRAVWNGGNVMMVENTWDMFTERNELLGSIRDEGAMGRCAACVCFSCMFLVRAS